MSYFVYSSPQNQVAIRNDTKCSAPAKAHQVTLFSKEPTKDPLSLENIFWRLELLASSKNR